VTARRSSLTNGAGRARLAVICALALATELVASPSGAAGVSPWKEAPQRFTLSTGQVCLYQRDLASAMTVVNLFVPGGKSVVPAGKDGLAFITTRLTLEIPDYSVAQNIMAQATRMRLSVFEDCSIISLECLSENLEETLRTASEIIQSPLFSGPRIDNVKDLMKIFARTEEDDAVEAGHAAALGAFFNGQGYGSAAYGTPASLKAIGKKDITSFYGKFFVRNAIVFSVCSDLPRERVEPLLETFFAGFPSRPAEPLSSTPAALPEIREVILEKDTKQAYVGRAFLLPPLSAGDYAKGYLLEVLLGVGPGSRLWELRESEELAYNVGSRSTWTKGCGVLEAYLETGNEKRARAVAALDAALTRLREKGLAAGELAMTKSLARANLLRTLEGKKPRSEMMGLWEVLGLGFEAFTHVFDSLEAVGLDEMNAYIRDRLDPAKSLLVIVGSGKPRG
jgi:zinc protease